MQSRGGAFKSGSAPIVNSIYLTLVFSVYTNFETLSDFPLLITIAHIFSCNCPYAAYVFLSSVVNDSLIFL